MVVTGWIDARSHARRPDCPRIHRLSCNGVPPRLRRRLARSDRQGGTADRLAGRMPDDLPLHAVLHDVLRNLAAATRRSGTPCGSRLKRSLTATATHDSTAFSRSMRTAPTD